VENKKFALYTGHTMMPRPLRLCLSNRVLINLKLVLVACSKSNRRELSPAHSWPLKKTHTKIWSKTKTPDREWEGKKHRHIKQKSFFKRCMDCYFCFPHAPPELENSENKTRKNTHEGKNV